MAKKGAQVSPKVGQDGKAGQSSKQGFKTESWP
jgi:hypothetical protein